MFEDLTSAERQKKVYRLAFQHIKSHPQSLLRTTFWGTYYLYRPSTYGLYWSTGIGLQPGIWLPGTVIMTGTPSGIGYARDPQVFLRPGDIAEIEIGGIGTLRNPVVAETA